MDKIERYRTVIRDILAEYSTIIPVNLPEVENQVFLDEERGLYQLIRVGFENRRRVHYCVFHFDIKNDKVWVQEDATDIPITQRLLDAGIPKEDIVLGFHAPYKRSLSGFAVA